MASAEQKRTDTSQSIVPHLFSLESDSQIFLEMLDSLDGNSTYTSAQEEFENATSVTQLLETVPETGFESLPSSKPINYPVVAANVNTLPIFATNEQQVPIISLFSNEQNYESQEALTLLPNQQNQPNPENSESLSVLSDIELPELTKSSRFTKAEDDTLLDLKLKMPSATWREIARILSETTGMPLRKVDQVSQHYNRALNPVIIKGKWTAEQDEQLIKGCMYCQPKEWVEVAAFVPGRTPNQCCYRISQVGNRFFEQGKLAKEWL